MIYLSFKSPAHSSFASRITLVNDDSLHFIPTFAATKKPDVIYLGNTYFNLCNN